MSGIEGVSLLGATITVGNIPSLSDNTATTLSNKPHTSAHKIKIIVIKIKFSDVSKWYTHGGAITVKVQYNYTHTLLDKVHNNNYDNWPSIL